MSRIFVAFGSLSNQEIRYTVAATRKVNVLFCLDNLNYAI